MITNERQYRITKAEAERFEQALAKADEQSAHLPPRLRRAMRESLESQLQELRAQFAEYEALRSGRVTVLELDSLADLPDALIRARTAAGLTQKQLAARLGLEEEQIQRYEATRYAGVSLARIQAVAEALGLEIKEASPFPRQQAKTRPLSVDNAAQAFYTLAAATAQEAPCHQLPIPPLTAPTPARAPVLPGSPPSNLPASPGGPRSCSTLIPAGPRLPNRAKRSQSCCPSHRARSRCQDCQTKPVSPPMTSHTGRRFHQLSGCSRRSARRLC